MPQEVLTSFNHAVWLGLGCSGLPFLTHIVILTVRHSY